MAGASETDVEVPPTLNALLAARLDQLEPRSGACSSGARSRASSSTAAPSRRSRRRRPQVTPRLAALVRSQLIQPDRAQLPGEDGFRFRHLLIRDAAYDALPKAARAELHERFADWLESTESISSSSTRSSATTSSRRPVHDRARRADHDPLRCAPASGSQRPDARALRPGDERPAARLLERALGLTRPLRLDVDLEIFLSAVIHDEVPLEAVEICDAAAARARAAGDERGEAVAAIVADLHRLFLEPDPDVDGLERAALAVLPTARAGGRPGGPDVRVRRARLRRCERARPDGGLGEGCRSRNPSCDGGRLLLGRYVRPGHGPGVGSPAGRRGAPDTRRARREREPSDSVVSSRCARPLRGSLARGACRRRALRAERRPPPLCDSRRPRRTRRRLRGCRALRRKSVDEWRAADHLSFVASYGAKLGRWLCIAGRPDEAEPLADFARTVLGQESEWLWRQVQARVLAHRGEHAQAELLAREAIAILDRADGLTHQGDGYWDLAEVLAAANRRDEAADALEQALDRYRRKKNLAMVAQVQPRLEALRAGAGP